MSHEPYETCTWSGAQLEQLGRDGSELSALAGHHGQPEVQWGLGESGMHKWNGAG